MTDFADEQRAGGRRPPLRGLWVTFLSPFALEVAVTADVEWVGLDLQHGDLELPDVVPLLRASPVPVLARVASHDAADLARVLDTGVDGVIVPAVESGEQAQELVAASYVPPRGRRSSGTSRATASGAPAQPLLLPMVETRAGLDAVHDIVGTDGVDGVFVGPYDLSLSLGHAVLAEPVVSAIGTVAGAAREAGRVAGVFAGNAELAARIPAVDLLAVDTDVAALRAGIRELFSAPSRTGRAPAW